MPDRPLYRVNAFMFDKFPAVIFALILSTCLVIPFSIDIFLSGLPAIAAHFPGVHVSLVLSIALLAFALAQPFYGPLFDRFGRRPVLISGLWIYTLASAAVMLSDSYHGLLVGRFFQAIGGCSTTIGIIAVVRDTYQGEQLLKVTSIIMAMIGISPTLAPLLGSVLNDAWGWRASFVFLFILGCFFLLLIQGFFKESLAHKNLHALGFKNIFINYHHLATQEFFLMYAIAGGIAFSVLFSYFSLSSLFLINQMHLSLVSYGLLVAVNAIALIGMALLAPWLHHRLSLRILQCSSFVLMLFGGVSMWAINAFYAATPLHFMLPMFITTIGIGLVRPVSSTGIMQLAPNHLIGSTSSLFNFIVFIMGAIASAFSPLIIDTVSDLGFFIVVLSLIGLALPLFNKVITLRKLLTTVDNF